MTDTCLRAAVCAGSAVSSTATTAALSALSWWRSADGSARRAPPSVRSAGSHASRLSASRSSAKLVTAAKCHSPSSQASRLSASDQSYSCMLRSVTLPTSCESGCSVMLTQPPAWVQLVQCVTPSASCRNYVCRSGLRQLRWGRDSLVEQSDHCAVWTQTPHLSPGWWTPGAMPACRLERSHCGARPAPPPSPPA